MDYLAEIESKHRELKMSRAKFFKAAGVDPSDFYRWRNKTCSPNTATLQKLMSYAKREADNV